MIQKNFGDNLQEILKEKNITQKELSLRTNLTETSISRYIHNTRQPKFTDICKISVALNITPNDLFYGNLENNLNDAEYDTYCKSCYSFFRKFTQKQQLEFIATLTDITAHD